MRIRKLLGALCLSVALIAPAPAPAMAAVGDCTPIVHRGMYDGTENQPAGVTYANQYGGIVEIDAELTKDGVVVALHDHNLNRLTGGDSTKTVNNVTWAELQAFDHPYGPFRETVDLIERAEELDVAIMVNLNRKSIYEPVGTFDDMAAEVWAAAADNPRPVYFGGSDGVERYMHQNYPNADTFLRFKGSTVTPDSIIRTINNRDIDVAGLASTFWSQSLSQRIKDAGARPATMQLSTRAQVEAASRADVNLIQMNSPVQATNWCF